MIGPLKLLAIPYIGNYYKIYLPVLLFVMQLFFNPARIKNCYL